MIDIDQLRRWVWQRATNDGAAHKRGAQGALGAIDQALKEYKTALCASVDEEFAEMRTEFVTDLRKRWRKR